MPLSPADVRFLNKLLAMHLKKIRHWSWMRWFYLGMAAFLVFIGMWNVRFAEQTHAMAFDLANAPATKRPFHLSSTLPVTQSEFWSEMSTHESLAFGYAEWESTVILLFAIATGYFLAAIAVIGYTLTRWNRHRRDALLIALLREKCAPELTPPIEPPACRG